MFYAGFFPGQTVPAQKGVAGTGPFVAPEAVFGQQFPVTATTQIPFQAVPAGWGAVPAQKGVAGAGPFIALEAVFGQQFPVTATTQIPFQAVPAGWGAVPTQAVWPGAAAPLVTQPFAGVPVFPAEEEADLYEDDILGIHPFRRGFRRRLRRFGGPFAKRAFFGKPFYSPYGYGKG
jgi:hypothetical protein